MIFFFLGGVIFVGFQRKTRNLVRILGKTPKSGDTGMGGKKQTKIAIKWALNRRLKRI